MAYNTTEAVAKFLSGFQMKITNRERDTVAPDYYVKYSLTLSKGGKDFSTLGYPWNGMVGADLDGLEAYGFAYPLSTQAATDWLEGDDLAKVNVFLKETCKEAFGILPGADDGGYSLSGEAKEAALSRFALPENRKAALNVIRKLNESRDSNDNAL